EESPSSALVSDSSANPLKVLAEESPVISASGTKFQKNDAL
ncbi:hypothetical protein A2U01_0048163, partial [Trifolium medium]|nr:hypothetical protein [Trifolium medium]